MELLYLGSIDTYRVKLNNPQSVLIELKYCLEQFQEGRIKHFHTIKGKEKDKKAIVDEVLMLLDYIPNYLHFDSITEKYLKQLLQNCSEDNYKRVISAIDMLLQENSSYLETILTGVSALLAANLLTPLELGQIDTSLNILFSELVHNGFHHRALVIDTRSPENGGFQTNVNILDRKYKVEKDHYLEFTRKLPVILNDLFIPVETKEKIKSAIRYLRLGNQSTEVEHKFINYWIGLEYLFSNYKSQNTINRIKDHFIVAHALAYQTKRLQS